MNIEKVTILGIPVARLNMQGTLAWVEDTIEKGKPAHVVTANAEVLYRAYREPQLAGILREAALVTADGFGVVWASRFLGAPVPARVTGVDLVQQLLALAEQKGWGVYYLGAKPEVVEKAVLNTLSRYPRLKICGYRHGYFTEQEKEEVMSNIVKVKPQILLVALGSPKQEHFIRELLARFAIPMAIGVGGTFDVLAGTAKRAPAWMQKRGLEWLYRLFKEPSRWRRMLALPRFVLAVISQKIFAKNVDKTEKML
ncbi:MAG TPA: WecB/TagA/CpsF family glycosyltransferase [Peptococcaceae bacterium]|nr:WecB/TagA/CpsF family glycosyltransferase [Peptococcaceae bacterium]